MKKGTAGLLAAAFLLSTAFPVAANAAGQADKGQAQVRQSSTAHTDAKQSGQHKTVKKTKRKGDRAKEKAQAAESAAPAAKKAPAAQPKTFLVKRGVRGEDVKLVQTLLQEMGYPVGEIDGICGPQTVEAIESFQIVNGLLPSGAVDAQTLARMKRAEPAISRGVRSIAMSASAYSAYETSGYTARGSYLRKGLVAVDPSVIPLGTRLYIPGYGHAIADDTGGAIRGNRIDLAFDSYEEAIQFGRRDVTVYIVS